MIDEIAISSTYQYRTDFANYPELIPKEFPLFNRT